MDAVKQREVVNRRGYLRKQEAAQYLGISIRQLTEYMQRRLIPYMKISHRVCLFRVVDIDQALERFRIDALGER